MAPLTEVNGCPSEFTDEKTAVTTIARLGISGSKRPRQKVILNLAPYGLILLGSGKIVSFVLHIYSICSAKVANADTP
jgi:hypothetical protein